MRQMVWKCTNFPSTSIYSPFQWASKKFLTNLAPSFMPKLRISLPQRAAWSLWKVCGIWANFTESLRPGELYREVTDWSTGRGKLDMSQLAGIHMVCCTLWDPLLLEVSTVIIVVGGKSSLPHTASQHRHHMSLLFLIVWFHPLISTPWLHS